MITRRTFCGAVPAGAAICLTPRATHAADVLRARNFVLVHGLFADGSCWSEVIPRLQTEGLNVTSVQNPLTTLDDAVAETQRVLDRQDGPTVLAGHSFSGMIVTEVGVHPKVSALVYVAARAPDAGEDYTALAKTYPTPPATAGIVFDGDEGRLTEAEKPSACSLCHATAVSQGAAHGQDQVTGLARPSLRACQESTALTSEATEGRLCSSIRRGNHRERC